MLLNEAFLFIIILLLVILVLGCLKQRVKNYQEDKQLKQAFFQREPLAHRDFYHYYFDNTNIPESVVEILESYFNTELSRLKPSDAFYQELGFLFDSDSLADVDIICAIEEKFNINISDDDAKQIATLNDMIHVISNKLNH